MAVRFEILGKPAKDNALSVTVDAGNSIHRLLFDCGEMCLNELKVSHIQDIDHLFFSHFHMDHVSGFDSFFRANYCRETKPVGVWGPEGTIEIMHHRFLGFVWNLVQGQPGTWIVREVTDRQVLGARFLAGEAFSKIHPELARPNSETILETAHYRVEARIMDHGTPSLAYLVRETPRTNVDEEALAKLGWAPGPWLQAVKDGSEPDDRRLSIDGQEMELGELRKRLLVTTPGESIAYLTDFAFGDSAPENLLKMLRGCDTIVCECQYAAEEIELARANYHLTSSQAAALAARAGAKRLILFHVSQRYEEEELARLLEEARNVFPETSFPDQWKELLPWE